MKAGDKVVCVKEDELSILTLNTEYMIEKIVKLGAYHNYESQIGLEGVPYYLWKQDKFKIVDSANKQN